MRQFYRWLFYLAGLFILALGLTLNTKTGLGVTPIISVPYSIAQVFGFNFGDATLAAYCLFVAIQFLLKGKPVRWADLLQLPLSLVFTRVLNLLDGAVPAAPQGMPARLCLLGAAILCTGVGAAMSVDMKLVPNPGDGIVAAIAQRTGRELGFTKNWFDTANVGITLVFGLVMGFLADISYDNTALFTALFPALGFFSGVLSRWYVNRRFFAYMLVSTLAGAVTAFFQMLGLLLRGHDFGPMLFTAVVQLVWSLPMAAALYFPCRAIARKKI